jgi:branched-chain amino acid transport system permease protein
MKKNTIWVSVFICVLLFIVPLVGKNLFPGLNRFFLHVATFICIMTMLALGLHIFFGVCGQINFGCNGFYAAGGYIAALLMIYLHVHFFLALPLAIIGTGVLTLLVGSAVLRLRHWVLALGTTAFGFAMYITLRTVGVGFMGGDDGLFVSKLVVFGVKAGPYFYYYFILAWTILCVLGAYFLENSRAGRAMRAIKEDETAAAVMGINVDHYVRVAFLLNGMYCGLAGALYAQWNRGVSPDNFSLNIAMLALVFVVVGGLGRLSGAIIGTVILNILPEILIPLKEYELLIYALIFFLVIRFMPGGIVGTVQNLFTRTGVVRMKAVGQQPQES